MVCIGSGNQDPPKSAFLENYTILPNEQLYTAEGIRIINEFTREFNASGIVCINEKIACWLNDHRENFSPDVAFWFPKNNIIKDVLSKKKQIEIARHVGLKVPPTYIIDKDSSSRKKILSQHYPLCLRPEDPARVVPTFKAKLAYSLGELKSYLEELERFDTLILGQPFMNLPNLVVHGARTYSGKSIGLQGFIVERKFQGVTLTIRPYELDENLREKCIDFTDEFGLTGNYHFEFLLDKSSGDAHFLEINNRLGGTTAKVYRCGYDEPALALAAYGVKGTKNEREIKNIIVSNKQALFKYLVYMMKGRLTPLDYPGDESTVFRLLSTLWGVVAYKDEVFMLRDWQGTYCFYLGNLAARRMMR
jgi:hypothetical protein